jgi:hypothetical protein
MTATNNFVVVAVATHGSRLVVADANNRTRDKGVFKQ